MRLTVTKHHGLGNDFLVVLRPARRQHRLAVGGAATVRSPAGHRCRRSAGRRPASRTAAIAWCCTTPTGAAAEMSGNGIRCFAQAVARRAATTAASDRHRRRCAPGGDVADVRRRPRSTPASDMGPVTPIGRAVATGPISAPIRAARSPTSSSATPRGGRRRRRVGRRHRRARGASCPTSTSRSIEAGPEARRHHDAGARARRRRHRSVRHRRLRGGVGRGALRPGRRRTREKSPCTWTVAMPRFVSEPRPTTPSCSSGPPRSWPPSPSISTTRPSEPGRAIRAV